MAARTGRLYWHSFQTFFLKSGCWYFLIVGDTLVLLLYKFITYLLSGRMRIPLLALSPLVYIFVNYI